MANPLTVVRDTVYGFVEDEALTRGAAIAFYTTTSIGPLLFIVIAIAGVLASSPEGASLRVVAYPFAELNLRRFAAARAASLARVGPRFEDAVLARSLPMGRQQT